MARRVNGSKGSYQVGYGKPPKHTQYVKGQSGNPKGRPKGRKNYATIFRKICEEKIQVNGKNGPIMMTKYEAALTQLVNKAAQGEFKSICETKASYESMCESEIFFKPPSLTINFVAPPDHTKGLLSNSTTETKEEEEEK